MPDQKCCVSKDETSQQPTEDSDLSVIDTPNKYWYTSDDHASKSSLKCEETNEASVLSIGDESEPSRDIKCSDSDATKGSILICSISSTISHSSVEDVSSKEIEQSDLSQCSFNSKSALFGPNLDQSFKAIASNPGPFSSFFPYLACFPSPTGYYSPFSSAFSTVLSPFYKSVCTTAKSPYQDRNNFDETKNFCVGNFCSATSNSSKSNSQLFLI